MSLENIDEGLKKNADFFEKNKDKIRKKYGEKTYVVIKNQEIIDSGPNNFELAKKYSKNRDEGIFITRIETVKHLREI